MVLSTKQKITRKEKRQSALSQNVKIMTKLKLKELRKTKNWTQADMAEEFNVNDKVYQRYETEITQMPYDILEAIAKKFDVTTDYILGMEHVHKVDGKKYISVENLNDSEILLIKQLIDAISKKR